VGTAIEMAFAVVALCAAAHVGDRQRCLIDEPQQPPDVHPRDALARVEWADDHWRARPPAVVGEPQAA